MSSDIYAKVDLSKKMRYNGKVGEDGVEWGGEQTAIDENPGAIEDHQTDFQLEEDGPHTRKQPPVQTRSVRGAALCLGALCLLMMVGIIILSTCYHLELQGTPKTFLSDGKAKDGTELNNNTRCQKSYETLSKNYSLLQDEVKELKDKIEAKLCPGGWKKFGSSCYFKSTENRTWYESRRYCESRGSDLVIINSEEEQDFITDLNVTGVSWIGLRTVKQNETHERWGWEWVDGSPLTQTFWVTGQLEDPKAYFYAACCDQQGKWMQTVNWYKNWICEKNITIFT